MSTRKHIAGDPKYKTAAPAWDDVFYCTKQYTDEYSVRIKVSLVVWEGADGCDVVVQAYTEMNGVKMGIAQATEPWRPSTGRALEGKVLLMLHRMANLLADRANPHL
jgi:hypothetical protein